MLILRLATGRWTICAVCSAPDVCPLLDYIDDLEGKLGNKVLSDLREFVPQSNPADWARNDFSKALKGTDGIFEYRWPRRKGPTPRILWFYDSNHLIVCCHGFNKSGEMDDAEVRKAEHVRAAYIIARDSGQLEFTSIDEFDADIEE